MSRRRFTSLLLLSTSVTMAASCSPTVVLPPSGAMPWSDPSATASSSAPSSTSSLPSSSPSSAPASAAGALPFPKLIAHRGGTADRPENTILAIDTALANGADMIWLSVQLSADDVPVLYRPADLSSLTDGKGPVAGMTLEQLQQLNAGWTFTGPAKVEPPLHPYRERPLRIPTLREALQRIPASVPVVLDMKAMPAALQTVAVAKVLDKEGAWGRVLIYSTEADYQRTFAAYPKARLFESRDATRQRLADATLGGRCDAPGNGTWAGFELHRKVTVTETFTLGKGETVTRAAFWNPRSVACYRSRSAVNLVAFGVNDKADYCEAMRLGVDAVMVDSPARMRAIRARLKTLPAPCVPKTPNADNAVSAANK